MSASPSALSDTLWSQLSEFVAERIGLHFPPERRDDLKRGLTSAAVEFGFADVAVCAEWLLSAALTKAQIQQLAGHLTVGETYFFREKKAFDVLAGSVLPEMIRSRRNGELRLRIWSAACCTGEEAYSLAMLLDQVIPDLPDWQVTILATDKPSPECMGNGRSAKCGPGSRSVTSSARGMAATRSCRKSENGSPSRT